MKGPNPRSEFSVLAAFVGTLEQLRGRYGRTVSSLRPAGITEFDGRRIDTMSDGTMIEPGQWVRCIDVRAGKVVVRQVDRPPDLADMEPTELA